MTDAAPPAETPPAASPKPRALWPWVLGTVVLLLGTLAFSFWWPMHRAGRLIERLNLIPLGGVDVVSSHPKWFDWLFGEDVFHPWFDEMTAVSALSDVVNDEIVEQLAESKTLGLIGLDVSNVSSPAMSKLCQLPSISEGYFQLSGPKHSLDWLREVSFPTRMLITSRTLSADDWRAVSTCKSLTFLTLESCDVGDPISISRSDRLATIQLADCILTRSFGASLSRLRELDDLLIGGHRIEAEFFRGLADARMEFALTIFGPELTDDLVEALREVESKSTIRLELFHRDFDAGAIRRIGTLRNLTDLVIMESTVPDGDVWEALTQLESLAYLKLSGTNVGDLTAAVLARIPNLEWLDLSDTKITDTGLRSLEASTSLKELHVSGTALTLAQVKAARLRRPDLEISAHSQEQLINAGETAEGAEPEP